ncbi:non-ribosomal peptide synthetase [Streptomyces sp. CB03911]|uniref:non-ribosomal peptide synthetase n=1 Tax=Streptomyces sp. CB03911 TaxID=1804758 RepID=UPI00093B7A40|nr:non-ribosomal peptide synthetase [Streptomyces sp. CB03911]OKI12527.1 non-ribosomal peptide synthetase [Streptomyces sp. CB03911]
MTAADAHAAFPLTEIQYAYWVGRGPNFVLGNVAPHAYFEMEGRRLDHALLTRGWRRLLERHGMLRAVVHKDGRQQVLPEAPPFEVGFEDLSDADPATMAERLAEIRADMSERVYDPAVWPLFDIRISRLPDHDRLHVSLDLLMVDLASITLLFTEWSALCQDETVELPPIDVTFRDYVTALEAGTDAPRYKRSLDYWASRAETLAPPPELPLARPPVQMHKPRFTHREFHLPPDEWQRFQQLAEQRGLTPTAVLATVFAEVLAAWSGTPRFSLNLTIFNRLPLLLAGNERGHRTVHPHLRRVVGDFTSICLLEMDTTGDLPVADLAARTQTQLQHDLRHRYVSALHTLRERRRRGLQTGFEGMPVVFTSGLGTVSDASGPMAYFGDITYRLSQTPQIWLDHQVLDVTGSLDLTWDAVEELFPEGVLDDMFAAYCGTVQRLTRAAAWDDRLDIPLPAHQLALREAANTTAGPAPAGLLHEALFQGALAHPDRPAVLHGTGTVSYRELADQAAAVAEGIGRLTDEPLRDRLVGITLPKGPGQVAAAHGVLLASAAYLPVGPALPARRRAELFESGEALAVVTDQEHDDRLEWPAGLHRIRSAAGGAVLDAPPAAVRAAADPADLAYVLYTSGSTGRPKGVMIEHRAALNTVADINERFGVGPDDRLFGLADLGFDLSVYDLFGSMAAGAALVLPDEDKRREPSHWAELMARHGVTVWNSVPAQMQMLVEHLEDAPAESVPAELRLVLLSGDWIPLDLPDRILALWPDAEVISLGGATEASIWSNWHPADDVAPDAPSIPYGKPLRNQAFHVLDAAMRPCPVWVAGELYIEGAGLARGYWRDPERTAASFVQHPVTGERLYRTGDFGRYLPDGALQFLGRRDGQVKIGGHRIECGEVEAVLARHPGVESAVVVKSVEEGAAAKLLGFVVPDRSDGSLLHTETADPAETARCRQALRDAAQVPAPGPGVAELRTAWAAMDDVYVAAAATAFRALGLPHTPGERFDPAAALAAGVAPRYERWVARAVGVLCDRGLLRRSPQGLEVARTFPALIADPVAESARQALRTTLGVPDDLIDWMLSLAGGLADILTQSMHSAELYASDRTPEVYARLFGPAYHVATEAVRRFVADWPEDRPLRILEVGGGYGTLTRHLLPLLPADRTDYLFTDISPYFTDRAREVFGAYGFLRPGLFNLDQSPELQGHEGLSADLVIAASVLHDIRRIGPGLDTLRSALAPGGTLLMVEQTAFHPWFDLTMGLQQGFDGYEDTELRGWGHPLLDRSQWADLLEATGFGGSAVLTRAEDGPASVGFDVIAADGPPTVRRFDREALREYAAERLPKHMVPTRLLALDRLPLSRTGKVDRGTLAKAGARRVGRSRAVQPPQTDRQLKLVEIYRAVLGLNQVDLADDFLEAGGDSLLAARISAALQRAFGTEVPVGIILQHPTVAALDSWLEPILGPATALDDQPATGTVEGEVSA